MKIILNVYFEHTGAEKVAISLLATTFTIINYLYRS